MYIVAGRAFIRGLGGLAVTQNKTIIKDNKLYYNK